MRLFVFTAVWLGDKDVARLTCFVQRLRERKRKKRQFQNTRGGCRASTFRRSVGKTRTKVKVQSFAQVLLGPF